MRIYPYSSYIRTGVQRSGDGMYCDSAGDLYVASWFHGVADGCVCRVQALHAKRVGGSAAVN